MLFLKIMGKYDFIIDSLSDDEIHLMEIIGGLDVSPNKNIAIESLKKRMHGKYEKNMKKILKSLKNKGLIGDYRSNNICTSIDGLMVAKILYEKKLRKSYRDLTYL
jgi:hypothetical protein